MAEPDDVYRRQSRWSDPRDHAAWLTRIAPAPEAVARHVGGLLVHCLDARFRGITVPAEALRDVETRSAADIIGRVRARDAGPATVARDPASCFFGVCAHYALVSTAVLRAHGVPARVRVGFAAYFVPGSFEDHWVTEYRDARGWPLLDAQLDDRTRAALAIAFPAWDVRRDRFLDASTAWCRLRAGTLDPARVGVTAVGLAGRLVRRAERPPRRRRARPRRDAALGHVGSRARDRAARARRPGRPRRRDRRRSARPRR